MYGILFVPTFRNLGGWLFIRGLVNLGFGVLIRCNFAESYFFRNLGSPCFPHPTSTFYITTSLSEVKIPPLHPELFYTFQPPASRLFISYWFLSLGCMGRRNGEQVFPSNGVCEFCIVVDFCFSYHFARVQSSPPSLTFVRWFVELCTMMHTCVVVQCTTGPPHAH